MAAGMVIKSKRFCSVFFLSSFCCSLRWKKILLFCVVVKVSSLIVGWENFKSIKSMSVIIIILYNL